MATCDSPEEALAAIDWAVRRSDEVPPEGREFASSVRTKLMSIRETIERTRRVTVKQARAVDNMALGIEKWLPSEVVQ